MKKPNLTLFRFSLILILFLAFSCSEPQTYHDGKVYVSPEGNDSNPGTVDAPLATPFGAKQFIAYHKMKHQLPENGIEVIFKEGTYHFDQPLQFTPDDSGTPEKPITFRAAEGEKVIFSGGRPITGWENTEPGVWKVNLPEVANGEWYFRQLFADGRRLNRARTPNEGYFTTKGPLKKYRDQIKPWDFLGRSALFKNAVEAFCGFEFYPNDISFVPEDIDNAEVLTHHSWESSWQSIRNIDLKEQEIHFNSPSWCPIGFFGDDGAHARYRIENYFAALDQPGEWYLNKKTGELFYMAEPGENVPEMEFIAPSIDNLITIEAINPNDPPVSHIRFEGIRFEHTATTMGVYVNSSHEKVGDEVRGIPFYLVPWPDHALKQDGQWPKNFLPGFMEPQAALNSGQAIMLNDAAHITIENCTIAHTGGYAINVGSKSHDIHIKNNEIMDTGSGGIRLGIWATDVKMMQISTSEVPYQNQIVGNIIRHIGKVHPGAVGIWLAQAKDNLVSHNELSYMPYSGISLGWTWNSAETYTQNNVISHNHIHHVLQTLTDGGGIYTLGQMEGCTLEKNYIHHIERAQGAIGSHSNGIFFDQASQHLLVDSNLIHDIGNEPVRYNQTSEVNLKWGDNFLEIGPGKAGFPEEIMKLAGPVEREI